MIVGDRLRMLREQKEFSQGEIEKRTGLLRCYISRVENGTRFRLSRRWRSSHAPWKSRCTNSFTTMKNRPSY
jgi:transcriptional regulator with XRE-family HTH domain